MMQGFAHWVVRWRIWVIGAWVGIAVLGGVAAPMAVDRLSYDFSLPGQPGFETSQEIRDRFGSGGDNPPIVLIAQGAQAQEGLRRAQGRIRQALPGVLMVKVPGGSGGVAASMVFPQPLPGPDPYVRSRPVVSQIADSSGGPGARITAADHLSLSEGGGQADRGLLVEIAIGAVGALAVLLLVFSSVLAAAPLTIAGVSILSTFLVLLGVTHVMNVSFIVQFLIGLIGLGIAIDFSLLITMRWREEVAAGRDNAAAVRIAVTTAGHSVLVSGLTVAISLAMLLLIPVPFLRSVGVGGLLIPLFSVATSLTLLPAVLSLFGTRLLWPRRTAASTRSRFWAACARATLRHRWPAAILTSALLILLAWPVTHINLGSPPVAALTKGRQDLALIQAPAAGLPVGMFRPSEVIGHGPLEPGQIQALRQIPNAALALDPSGDRAFLMSRYDPTSVQGGQVLEAVRQIPGIRVGGTPALDADFIDAIYRQGAWALLPLNVVTFFLLARALASLWLPLKALALNSISIAAAYGITVRIWQEGHLTQTLFGLPSTGVITMWVPVAAFAFLFGLSMDYEVFILSRMRESFDRQGDTDVAVEEGIANTGRLVSSGALILIFAFVGLATVPTVEVKILATTLAFGIALDALVVRAVLVPALVGCFGHLNWVMPRWLRHITRRV